MLKQNFWFHVHIVSVTLLTKEDMYNQVIPIDKCCLLTVLISENIGNRGEDCDKYVEEDKDNNDDEEHNYDDDDNHDKEQNYDEIDNGEEAPGSDIGSCHLWPGGSSARWLGSSNQTANMSLDHVGRNFVAVFFYFGDRMTEGRKLEQGHIYPPCSLIIQSTHKLMTQDRMKPWFSQSRNYYNFL